MKDQLEPTPQKKNEVRRLTFTLIQSIIGFVAVWQGSVMMGCRIWIGGALFAAVLPFVFNLRESRTKATKGLTLVSLLVVVALGFGLFYLTNNK